MPLDSTAYMDAMGPSLLASEPLSVSHQPEMADWWPTYYQHLERRLASLRNWRWTWWNTWWSLGEFFLPRRMRPYQIPNNFNRGMWLNSSIIDTTGSQAAQTCASGMWSGLTNPARPWFSFGPAIENFTLDEVAKEWLQDTAARVSAVLHQSNFYGTMAQFFQDVTVFGTSPLIVYEDEEDVIRCYLPCAGEYFLAAGARLTVDTFFREFVFTVIQIVEMFGLENCPEFIRMLWRQGGGVLDQELIIGHSIEPNYAVPGKKDGKRIGILSGKFPFRECYWVRGQMGNRPLSLRGFDDQPFMAGRWSVVQNDPYGRGPGMDALGDQKQVQQETRRKAEFIEKGVRPPMIADPSMKNEPASVMPGMVTFVNTANGNNRGFMPAFEVNAVWLQHLTADIAGVNQRIKDAFYVPQFMAITQMQGVQPRNELELTKRDLERLQMLGPVIDLFEGDVASPALQRVVRIMQRRGMLKPVPPSLQNVPLKITYLSLMRMAQKSAESVGLKDFAASIGTASLAAKNAGVPDPARIVNWDNWARHMGATTHVPRDILFTPDQVAQNDQAGKQAEEQIRQQKMASEMSKPAVDAAKVLQQGSPDDGSYLSRMLSGGAAGG